MAICKLNKDLLRSTSCGYALPQLTDLYIANMEDVTSTAIKDDASGCTEVTGITMAASAKWYHIEPLKDSTEYSDTLQVGDNQNKYRAHSITFSVGGQYDGCQVGVLDSLSLGRFVVVAKTAEGNYIMFGRITGMEADADGATLNQNGLTFTLSANTTEAAIPLSEDAVQTVLGNA